MRNRIISTALLWIGVIIICWALGRHGANLLLVAAAALTQIEFYTLMQRMGMKPMLRIGTLAGVFVTAGGFYLSFDPGDTGLIGVLAIIAVALVAMFREGVGRMTAMVIPTLAGLALIALPLAFFNPILLESGIMLAIWVIVTAKFTDVGGLLVGMAIGKTLLAPAISPKKTWEGVAGGLAFSIAAGLLVLLLGRSALPEGLTILKSIAIAIPVALASICSDLFESAVKREAGVKDSGSMIPGIGGAYDLTDSLIFAVPVAYMLFGAML